MIRWWLFQAMIGSLSIAQEDIEELDLFNEGDVYS
jgi:hypothetical protein